MINPECEAYNLSEEFHPGHFYAAYVFDRADTREEDIRKVLAKALDLGYPTRYWWLSDALDLQGFPDRLIVCVHHPSAAFDAGIDLYDALTEQQAHWDDLEAAALFEYLRYGHPTQDISDLHHPDGRLLYPQETIK